MKLIKIEENKLTFSDGSTIEDYHESDCCESVYADWKQLQDTDILAREFEDIKITGVKGSGIKLNGYFIPCYNHQNGYYSSDLHLTIKIPGKPDTTVGISDFVEDQID
jgi:hypothetical protein